MASHRSLAVVVAGLVAQGCVEPADVSYGEVTSELSVASYVQSGCTTAVVIGLSRQIADEVACSQPGALAGFEPGGNLTFTSNAVLPYLAPAAKAALANVTSTYSIQVNSSFRTVAQQYLLYRWYQQGRCGITAAATPGRSNHQSGRALDIANYSSRITAMRNAGWTHLGANDPVHFDHLASADIRGEDVRAFQRLWNRNHPEDMIGEDGVYGPDTEARLSQAPATGFPIGASCGQSYDASGSARVLSIVGPDRVAPSSHATYSITVQNTGTVAWPATTRLVTADGTASELYDPASWTSQAEVGPINTTIAAGAQGVIDFDVETRVVSVETPAFARLALVDGTQQLGTLNIALIITPNGDENDAAEAGEDHEDHEDEHEEQPGEERDWNANVSGGCNAGTSSGFGALLAPVLLGLVRRRRR
ncbi:MAG TPA: D-alanyl-D-alanine carboxypeptidase family protein [Kofleriaceae bacterium]|nr:D-alanyl-D-alanine carboxypeptidase family protein [Kofleriaceae bacterium]